MSVAQEGAKRAAQQRQRRTERQREQRQRDRICGFCRKGGDGGLIEWAGRAEPLLIPICRACRAMLAGSWLEMKERGIHCPAQREGPCADCISEPTAESSKKGILRRLLSG